MKKRDKEHTTHLANFFRYVLGISIALLIVGAPFAYTGYQNAKANELLNDDGASSTTEYSGKSISSPSQPAQNKASSPTSSSKQRTFYPGGCTKKVIPYQTEYMDDATMYVGETREFLSGKDGYTQTCTAAYWSDETPQKPTESTVNALSRVIKRGTKTQTSTGTGGYTYAQAMNLAQSNCRAIGANGSAWQQCIDAYMHKFGF